MDISGIDYLTDLIYFYKKYHMQSRNLFIFSIILAVTIFFSCGNAGKEPATNGTEGSETVTSSDNNEAKQLPAFKMLDAQGNVVDLTSFNGKKIFVNLWASWCPPCRREMPSIQKLYNSVDPSKVAFIMLALDDSFDKSKDYVNSKKLNMPLYYPAEALPALFNVPGIPVTFIFNEQGQIIHKTEGSDDYDKAAYRKLLQ
jgi:thiol-disulfide isomerase/thioredoxin